MPDDEYTKRWKKSKKKIVDLPLAVTADGPPYILPQLWPFVINISELSLDPGNPNTHPKEDIESKKAMLKKFGQRLPLSAQKTTSGLLLRAGEGRLLAMKELGWDRVAVIVHEEDNTTAAAFSIADNQTAKNSKWDVRTLASLVNALELDGFDLNSLAFDKIELDDLAFDFDMAKLDGTVSPPEETEKKVKKKKLIPCPSCGYAGEA